MAPTFNGALGLTAAITISGSEVNSIVIVPSCVAVPSNVETLLTIAYAVAPVLIVALEIVTKIGLPEAVSGTVPSPAIHEIAIEIK